MKVKKRNLLLIASIVWGIAGFNVLKIGITSYINYVSIINITASLIIFSLFWFLIFKKLVNKHTIRIKNYKEEKQFFLNFFDLKSFLIMFFMITLGIIIRKFNLLPEKIIAIFYSGLGTSLFLAGILFLNKYLIYNKK